MSDEMTCINCGDTLEPSEEGYVQVSINPDPDLEGGEVETFYACTVDCLKEYVSSEF